MSVERCFLDTNVLIYLFDNDSPAKQARAQALLDEEQDRIVLSTQILGEFYVNVTRKLDVPLPPMRRRRRSRTCHAWKSHRSPSISSRPPSAAAACRGSRTGIR